MIGQGHNHSKASLKNSSMDILTSRRLVVMYRASLVQAYSCMGYDTISKDTCMHARSGCGSTWSSRYACPNRGIRVVSRCGPVQQSIDSKTAPMVLNGEIEQGYDSSSSISSNNSSNDGLSTKITSINQAKCQLKFVIPSLVTGCIIGKNGSNLEQIRSQTGAFIQANAPGSAVSSRKERFIIVASDSMDGCMRGVESMLRSIESENKIELLKNSPDGSLCLKQVIPGGCAGGLIGLKGYNVERLSEESCVRIRVDPRPKHAGIVPFRMVSYTGSTVEQLIRGVQGVVNCLQGDEQYLEEIKAIKSVVLKVVQIPEGRVGPLIGPKGLHLHSLEQVLRCKLAISKSSSMDEKVSYYLTAWGQPENVRAAIRIVFLNQSST